MKKVPVYPAPQWPASQPRSSGCRCGVYDLEGKETGEVELSPLIFEARINPVLMAQAIRVSLANRRKGTASTKTRGEVIGSNAKIWRQKGTGRARHGNRKAPIFVGGGVAHGPKPGDKSLKLSQKMRRLALFSALTVKLKENHFKVVEGVEKIKGKTKELAGLAKENTRPNLLILPEKARKVFLAGRNLAGLNLLPASGLNCYNVLLHEKIIFAKEALPVLEKTFLPVPPVAGRGRPASAKLRRDEPASPIPVIPPTSPKPKLIKKNPIIKKIKKIKKEKKS